MNLRRVPSFIFPATSVFFGGNQGVGSKHYCSNSKTPFHKSRCSNEYRPAIFPAMSSSTEPLISVVEIGMGTDLHGQNATVAATRACRNAIETNSLPGLARLLPNGDFSKMRIDVKLGVPQPFLNDVDLDVVQKQFPYGSVNIEIEVGGLVCSSGVVLEEQGDGEGDDRAIIVVAAVTVRC